MVVGGVAFGGSSAEGDLVETAVVHVVGKFGVRVHGVVVRLDAVRVINSKLGIMVGLDGLVDDAVDYAERVEVEWVSGHASVLDLQVLVVEVAEECWTIVAAVGLGEEVEVSCSIQVSELGIKLGDGGQKGLENVLHVSDEISAGQRHSIIDVYSPTQQQRQDL